MTSPSGSRSLLLAAFVVATLVVPVLGQAQSDQKPLAFEVASIKPSAQSAQAQTSAGLHIDGSVARYSALSLKLYLGMAYNLRNYQISAPDWMASERWDITAKLPDGSDPKQIPQMLQALLRDRFQIKTHRETRELPVYGLITGKGRLKLKPTA